ncbi:MAG: D-glycerate dehydrogenase, partial [Gemmatimonadaceae bacterium]
MSRPTVIVTRKLPASVEKAIASRYDAKLNVNDVAMTTAQLKDAMGYADAMLCTVTDKITDEVFTASKRRVKIIANYGVGINHINRAAAKAAGIVVTNTPDVLTDDTADIALALILMTMRRLGEGERH